MSDWAARTARWISSRLWALSRRKPLAAFSKAVPRAEPYLGVPPAFDVSADPSDGPVDVLDDVGAGERTAQVDGRAQAGNGEDLVKALQDAGGDAGCVIFQSTQPFGLVGVVQFLRLAQRLADAGMQGLGEAVGDVAGLMDRQRWIGIYRPKVLRIALDGALVPSMLNRPQTTGSRPRPLRLSNSACITAAFSVVPLITLLFGVHIRRRSACYPIDIVRVWGGAMLGA